MININGIKETILYYIVCIWMDTWIYNNVFKLLPYAEEVISNCINKDEAQKSLNIKLFKYIPKSYKRKLLDDKFN